MRSNGSRPPPRFRLGSLLSGAPTPLVAAETFRGSIDEHVPTPEATGARS